MSHDALQSSHTGDTKHFSDGTDRLHVLQNAEVIFIHFYLVGGNLRPVHALIPKYRVYHSNLVHKSA